MNTRALEILTTLPEGIDELAVSGVSSEARALGQPELPLAIIPHPLGPRSRKELQDIVARQLEDIVKLVSAAK